MHFNTLVPLVLTLTLVHALGGTEIESKNTSSVETTPFDQGKFELQSATGAYLSVGHANEPSLNYSSSSYRLGVMLYSPSGDGFFRGNCELMLQVFGGTVFNGPGNYLGGAAAVLRYNFVQPQSKWVPYVQVATGAVYNDIYKDRTQSSVGRPWALDLEATVGLRYFLSDRWSVILEAGYRNNSNLDSTHRDVGLNSLGAGIGLGRYF
jgi:lipid A 3-O-deacylase